MQNREKRVTSDTQNKLNILQKKRGFTVVELTIVIALLAVVSVMIVSFSSLIGKHVTQKREQNELLEEISFLRASFYSTLYDIDQPDTVFTIDNDGLLTVTRSDSTATQFYLTNGTFYAGTDAITHLKHIDRIYFSVSEDAEGIIKLIALSDFSDSEKEADHSFVFSLRCAKISYGEGANE